MPAQLLCQTTCRGRRAEGGRRHREGKQGGGEGPYGTSLSIKHTCCLQPLAGQPKGVFSPTGRGCCQTAFQKASPAAAPSAGGPEALPHLRFAALTIPAILCTTVLGVTNPLTPLCSYTRTKEVLPFQQQVGRSSSACGTSARA